jgi:hypothetical protein
VFSGIFLGGFNLVWVVWVFLVLALVGCFLLYITSVLRGTFALIKFMFTYQKKVH